MFNARRDEDIEIKVAISIGWQISELIADKFAAHWNSMHHITWLSQTIDRNISEIFEKAGFT